MEIKTKFNIGDEVWMEWWHENNPTAESFDREMNNYRSKYGHKKIESILYHKTGDTGYFLEDIDKVVLEDKINTSKKELILRDIDNRIELMQKSIGILCEVREKISAMKESKV